MILKVKNENGQFKEVVLKGLKGDKGDRGEDGTVLQQKEIDDIKSSLDNIANKGTTVEVLERVTKEEIDRQIKDGTIANLTIEDGSITSEKFSDSCFIKKQNTIIETHAFNIVKKANSTLTYAGFIFENTKKTITSDDVFKVSFTCICGEDISIGCQIKALDTINNSNGGTLYCSIKNDGTPTNPTRFDTSNYFFLMLTIIGVSSSELNFKIKDLEFYCNNIKEKLVDYNKVEIYNELTSEIVKEIIEIEHDYIINNKNLEWNVMNNKPFDSLSSDFKLGENKELLLNNNNNNNNKWESIIDKPFTTINGNHFSVIGGELNNVQPLSTWDSISAKPFTRLNSTQFNVVDNTLNIIGSVDGGTSGNGKTFWSGKKAVFLGDSITQQSGTTGFIGVLKERLGLRTVVNYGSSGSCISYSGSTNNSFFDRIPQMDNDADLIVVFGGTNDHGTGQKIGSFGDTEPPNVWGDNSFHGGCYKVMEMLLEKYPTSTIVFLTPTHKKNDNGLIDYVEAIKQNASFFSIPVCDLYSISGIQPNFSTHESLYTKDGLHLTALAYEKIGRIISNFINNL